jgi:undecaprenyl diphosphate synthase
VFFCLVLGYLSFKLKGLEMQHLAIIPDGNRRWAKKNKLQAILGHQSGGKVIKSVISACLKNDIKYVSIYIFSLENLESRSAQEQKYLFKMIPEQIKENLPDLIKHKVKVRFIGDSCKFPESLISEIKSVEEKTKNFDALNLSFMFCYGGRHEILHAVNCISKDISNGILVAEKIDEQVLRRYFWTSDLPDPDLIIRTSGISRLSNFFAFQSAYSELMFLDCYWPEVTQEILQKCIDDYKNIARNFGK